MNRYLVYLNNYHIRQCEAQYLSVMYEILGKNLTSHFIFPKEYLKKYKIGERWEVRWVKNHWGSYDDVFNRLKPENYTVIEKPENLADFSKFTPSEILRYVTEFPFQEQIEVIEDILKNVTKIKAEMRSCGSKLVLMSGSGPSVFGLFSDAESADNAAAHLRDIGYDAYSVAFCE